MVFTPHSPMRNGFWTTIPCSFPSRMAFRNGSLESKPRNTSLPALLMSSKASNVPAVEDSLGVNIPWIWSPYPGRSEEHTSELQSLAYLVCRLLLEKKKITDI